MTIMDALLDRAAARCQPAAGTFELTARCNLSCKMCYIHELSCDKELRKDELTTAQWLDMAHQVQEMGTLPLLLTGGEPTLRPDFAEIYNECVKLGFLISVNTNGTLISEELFRIFAKQKPLRLNISLYGMRPEVYEELCGSGAAYERVTSNIRRLREMGITVKINFTATPYNYKEMAAANEFAKSVGSIIHFVSYMFPPVRKERPCEQDVRRFTPVEAAEASIEWLRTSTPPEYFAEQCRKHAELPPNRADECLYEGDEGSRCRAGRASYWITYKGDLLPCGMIPSISRSIPRLGFRTAWEQISEEMCRVRMPKGCLSCPDYKRCEVCAAITWAENEDFSMVPQYICDKNRHYHERLAALGAEGSPK